MDINGTQKAFLHILEERGVFKKLDVSRSTVSVWKTAIKSNAGRNFPSLDLMEKLLEKYGATVVQEKIWNIKDEPRN